MRLNYENTNSKFKYLTLIKVLRIFDEGVNLIQDQFVRYTSLLDSLVVAFKSVSPDENGEHPARLSTVSRSGHKDWSLMLFSRLINEFSSIFF